MKQEKMDIIKSYIETNVAPILVEQVPIQAFPNAVVIEANCNISELNGHYEGTDFVPPKWYNDLLSKTDFKRILIINGIDSVPKDDQEKFKELLKYKKVSTFDIPSNTIIVLTVNNISSNISSEISSQVVMIKD